jgi:hypothetical protein
MYKFTSDYNLKNQLKGVYSSIFGNQIYIGEDALELVLLVNISANKDEIELSRINKYISEDLFSFLSVEISAGRGNLDSLEKVQGRLEYVVNNVLEKDEELSKNGVDMNLILAMREGNFFYLYTFGDVIAILKRDNKFISLSDLLDKESRPSYIKIGSMQLQQFDRVGLGICVGAEKQDVRFLFEKSINDLSLEPLFSLDNFVAICLANEQDEWPQILNKELKEESFEYLENNATSDLSKSGDEYEVESNIDTEVSNNNEVRSYNINQINTNNLKNFQNNLNSKVQMISISVKEFLKKFQKLELSRGKLINTEEKNTDELTSKDVNFGSLGNTENTRLQTFISSLKVKLTQLSKSTLINNLISRCKRIVKNIIFVFNKYLIGGGSFDRRGALKKKKMLFRNRILFTLILLILGIFVYNAYTDAELKRQELALIEKTNLDFKRLSDQFQSIKTQVIQGQDLSDTRRAAIVNELSSISKTAQQNRDMQQILKDKEIQLQKDIIDLKDVVNKITPLTNVNIITDVAIHFSDARLSSMAVVGDNIFLSDSNRSVIYRVPTVGTGVVPQVFVTGLVQPYMLVKDPEENLVFFDNDVNASIGRISTTRENIMTRFQGLSFASVGKVNSASIFNGNGAIYEIRNINNQIFRRDKVASSFAGGGAVPTTDNTNWLSDSRLSTAVDIKTPYSIYVLSKGHGLLRFLSGSDTGLSAESFVGLSKEDFEVLKRADAFDIYENILVIADNQLKRVMVFERIGDEVNFQGFKFIRNYEYRGDKGLMSNMSKIYVLAGGKQVVVLDGSKVITLPIG